MGDRRRQEAWRMQTLRLLLAATEAWESNA